MSTDTTPAVRPAAAPARRDPVPASYSEAMQVGGALAKSGFFADAKSEAQAAAKVIAGMELGLGPMASMTGIHLVQGKVTLSANIIAALIKRSGRYDYRVKRLDGTGCVIAFRERGEVIGESSFTDEDAKAAGLWGKAGPWKQHPRNMLFARAMSNGAKFYCADVFAGPVYTPDELGASVDGETGEVIDSPTPTPPAADTTVLVNSRRMEVMCVGAPGGESDIERRNRQQAISDALREAGYQRDDLADDARYEAMLEVAQEAAAEHADGRAANADEAVATFGPQGEAITQPQMAALHAAGKEHGLDHAALHQLAADLFQVESMTEIPRDGMDRMLEAIEQHGGES